MKRAMTSLGLNVAFLLKNNCKKYSIISTNEESEHYNFSELQVLICNKQNIEQNQGTKKFQIVEIANLGELHYAWWKPNRGLFDHISHYFINYWKDRVVFQNRTETDTTSRERQGNKRTREVRECYLIEHIKLFKVIEFHLVRKEMKCEYLGDLSITGIYQLYKEMVCQ